MQPTALAPLLVLATCAVAQQPTDQGPRFVAIALASKNNGTREASIWQIPSQQPPVRRLVLGESSWAPSPLLRSVTVLRWQVPATKGSRRPYSVRVLRFDPDTFETSELLRAQQATPLGTARGRYLVQTDAGQLVLDPRDGSKQPLTAQIQVLAQHGDDWLVTTGGHLARFDPIEAKVVRHYPKLPAFDRSAHRTTIWNGGRYAVRYGAFFDTGGNKVVSLPFGRPGIVFQELRIADLDEGSESSVRVRTLAHGGSGVGVIPTSMPTELVGGMFRYVERRPATGDHADLEDLDLGRDTEWVTIDVATGKELLRKAYEPRQLDRPDPLAAARLPDYLRPAFADAIYAPADVDVARAFLADRGVEVGGQLRVARSKAGPDLLALTNGTLYRCDLDQRSLLQWPAPAEWQKHIRIDLYAVEPRKR